MNKVIYKLNEIPMSLRKILEDVKLCPFDKPEIRDKWIQDFLEKVQIQTGWRVYNPIPRFYYWIVQIQKEKKERMVSQDFQKNSLLENDSGPFVVLINGKEVWVGNQKPEISLVIRERIL